VLAFGLFAVVNQSFAKLGVFGAIAGFIGGAIVGMLNSWHLQKN
jgi:hypothetical protein